MHCLAYLLHILLLRDCVLTLPKCTYYHPHKSYYSDNIRSARRHIKQQHPLISSRDIRKAKEIGYYIPQRRSEVME